jgi:hypothetical protein
MPTEARMLSEERLEFSVELRGCDGGIALLPSPPATPKAHRFQGGLIRTDMMEITGRVRSPALFRGRAVRIWLNELRSWHFGKNRPPDIGDLYNRTGELPGGGLEAMIYIPPDAWPPSLHCLGAKWNHLALTGVDGDGRRMTVVDFSFSSKAADR